MYRCVCECAQPAEYCASHFAAGYHDGKQELKFAKGTTTLGFKFKTGVVIAVDSRSTQGSYIGAGAAVCVGSPRLAGAQPLCSALLLLHSVQDGEEGD